jgi:hypothetical protein
MDPLSSYMTSPTAAALYQGRPASGKSPGAALSAISSSASHEEVRTRVGELVGGIFYGTLLRETQKSSLKGKYMHGGRGEEVFQGQLNEELSRKLGQARSNPITNRLTREIEQHLNLAGDSAVQNQAATTCVEATPAGTATEGVER